MILEAQFALDQEGPEFLWVRAIKGVRFTDLGTGGRGVVGMMRGAGEAVDSNSEIVEDSSRNRFMVTWVCRTTKALRHSISMWSQRHCRVSSCKAPELANRSRRLPAVRQGLLGGRKMEVIYCTCFFSKCCSGMSMRARGHSHKGIETSLHTSLYSEPTQV